MKRLVAILFFIIAFISCQKKIEPVVEPNPEPPTPPTPVQPISSAYEFDNGKIVKGICLFDILNRNGEDENSASDGRNLYSAKYILDVAGLPYKQSSDLDYALGFEMVLISSPIYERSFSSDDFSKLISFVENGGVVIAPALIDINAEISQLFGITSSSQTKSRFSFSWNEALIGKDELVYIDDEEEKQIYIGDTKMVSGETIKSCGYTIDESATTLACFDTGESAIVKKEIGKGCTYCFGFRFRDVIQRFQLNKDFGGTRTYSNGFEITTDIFPLFVRATYITISNHSVWKATIPSAYKTVLIPTHDCDSKTAYQKLHYVSDYEKSLDLKAHYFLTVHYFREKGYSSAFYDDDSIISALTLIENNHTVGSHSIGHYPDFNKTERFPIIIDNKESHAKLSFHDAETNITSNGSTWSEIVLSKIIIQEDLGNNVRSFRSGHLCVNKLFPEVLTMGDYSFSSCYSAGDLHTTFPFFLRTGNSWEGSLSNVLEMPLSISDVFSNDPINEYNWKDKAVIWYDTLQKLSSNYSPTILLIHPNRDWKMYVQRELISKLNRNEVGLYNFEDYGDFWLNRDVTDVSYYFDDSLGKLLVKIVEKNFNSSDFTLVIESDKVSSPEDIVILNENNTTMPYNYKKVDDKIFVFGI